MRRTLVFGERKPNPHRTLVPPVTCWWTDNEKHAVALHVWDGLAEGQTKGRFLYCGARWLAKGKTKAHGEDRRFDFALKAGRIIGTGSLTRES